jgi:hypothetical protein
MPEERHRPSPAPEPGAALSLAFTANDQIHIMRNPASWSG